MVAGPSGVGKTTLLGEVLRRRPQTRLAPSATTRPRRPGETDSKYTFVDSERFEDLVHAKAFLEYAAYAGHLYGTLLAPVEKALAEGTDVVLEIEVQGARQVKNRVPDSVTIFIEPPSWEVLETRLRERATDPDHALEKRLATARHELDAAPEFEHRVINNDLDQAVEAVLRIMGSG
ncbi:MAG: guanylate kinase [Actinomycetota bacterium]|nr:guanylate kinase [Actinomycetota bacterium]